MIKYAETLLSLHFYVLKFPAIFWPNVFLVAELSFRVSSLP